MSRHVPAHRFAAAAAGRLAGKRAASDRRHADRCPRCAGIRDRLAALRPAMDDIATAPAPELGWDHIGARIYWSTSRELRCVTPRRRWPGLAIAAVGVTAAAALAFHLAPGGDDQRPAEPAARHEVAAHQSATAEPAAALGGVITFRRGDVRLDGAPFDFDAIVEAGAELSTGDGRVTVQFSPSSGFSLDEDSRLEVVSFDDHRVELVVDGVVDVDITRRDPRQEFAIVAGDHRVVVRGTAFRVGHRAGELEVTCTRGQVVVEGGAAEVDVGAGERFEIRDGAAAARAVALDPAELAAVKDSLRVPTLAAFPGARSLLDTSAALRVRSEPGRAVALDGVAIAAGDFEVRVMRGRHHLAAADADGTFATGSWIDAGAGGTATAELTPEPPPRAAPDDRAQRQRKRQLRDALDQTARARLCLDPLAKHGLIDGSYAVFDLGVEADGSQSHLNVVDSNLSPAIQRCLRGAIDAVALPDGPATRLRYRVAF